MHFLNLTARATRATSAGRHPGALLSLLVVGSALLFCGCQNPRAASYKTLAAVRDLVDHAETLYGDAVAAGRVTPAQEREVDKKITEFHAAYLAAVRAARSDYTTPTSPDLDRLAEALVSLIQTYAKEPAP